MTAAQIANAQRRAAVPYQVAAQVRELLDDARKSYGPTEWDDDDVEGKIVELVTGDA